MEPRYLKTIWIFTLNKKESRNIWKSSSLSEKNNDFVCCDSTSKINYVKNILNNKITDDEVRVCGDTGLSSNLMFERESLVDNSYNYTNYRAELAQRR